MSGGIVDVLQFAIDGVTDQINATSNDLANASTPGYTASDVSFEDSLAQAIGASGEASATITDAPSGAPAATNGNNVDLSGELVSGEKEALEYQQLSESLNDQIHLVSGVVGGAWQ